MNKKEAKSKALVGCFAGDLRELLNSAAETLNYNAPAKTNKNIRKQDAYSILHNAIANYAEMEIVVPDVAWKVLYEFA